MRWRRDHARLLRESTHYISARLATSLLVWLLVGIALALPAGLYLLQHNLDDVGASWDGRPGISVYFSVGAEEAVVVHLADTLRGMAQVESVDVTTAQQALVDFREHTGLDDALQLLDGNPLPASIRALLASGTSVAELERVADQAESFRGVQEVVVEKTWLERVLDMTTILKRLSVLLAVLFGVGALLVTATSVRLAIEARLEELKLQKLVGATDSQIRRPFLYFGAIYGTGGAIGRADVDLIFAGWSSKPRWNGCSAATTRPLNFPGLTPCFYWSCSWSARHWVWAAPWLPPDNACKGWTSCSPPAAAPVIR